MVMFRKVPFLTCEISPRKKVKINLSGCNFNCRGCFAIAKKECGRNLSVDELIDLLIKSCRVIYGKLVNDVQMTGGEPLTDIEYLFSLIQGLRDTGVDKIGIWTNGYGLNRYVANKLKQFQVDYVMLDLKAYSKDIHIWYTGKSNERVLKALRLLHEYGFNFYVQTIVIPNVVDAAEVEKIAKFISSVDRNIPYRLYEFAPEQIECKFSRRPTENEMLEAYHAARKHLKNVEFFLYKPKSPFYKTAYDPNYKVAEIRADELLETFERVDKIAKAVDPNWKKYLMKY